MKPFTQLPQEHILKRWGNWNKVRQEFGLTRKEAKAMVKIIAREMYTIHENDEYQVWRRVIEDREGGSNLIHLSIKRINREIVRDWRVFQEIKNLLVGPECEGMELYPAESRLVDTANQYHLWVFEDPKFRLPFGFQKREVSSKVPPKSKAKQRLRRSSK